MQRPPKNWIKQSTCYRRYAELELLSNSITWPACLVQTMNVLILFSPPLSLSLSYLGRKTNTKGYDQTFMEKQNKKKHHRPFKPHAGAVSPSTTFQLENSNPPLKLNLLSPELQSRSESFCFGDIELFSRKTRSTFPSDLFGWRNLIQPSVGKNWTLVPETYSWPHLLQKLQIFNNNY